MTCQICFEDDVPIASNDNIGGALCRRSCTARVCVLCLARHIEVSLAVFYAGVLPLIRCPICLVPMRVDRWTRPLGAKSATVEKICELRKQYEALCTKACALTTPCCHKMNYPHLPRKDLSFKEMSQPLALLPSMLIEFHKLIARFCGHRIGAGSAISYATESFGDDNAWELVERTLPRIVDSERRARLLFAFVHKLPNIKTRCCKSAICFEDDTSIAGSDDIGGALCRRSCTARVCVSCLARHIEVSLADVYAGVLPLIRCPICVLPMRLDRWAQPLGAEDATAKKVSELRNTYEERCKQACAQTSPCCHKMNYTHLPERDESAEHSRHDPELLQPEAIAFHKLIARFCDHHVDAQDVLAFAVDHFDKNDVPDLVERTLPRIDDSERRARLMLALLYKFPNIKTRCCKFEMCYNCKRIGHHDKCEEFEHAADESQCLVRCRNCRVMLMLVQGCDWAICVCGFGMSWMKEVKLRRLSKAKALPVDLFNKKAVEVWQRRRNQVDCLLLELNRKHEQIRQQRLDAWIQTHKRLVYRTVERWMWRHRFAAGLGRMERELYWSAYYRAHPDEASLAEEEISGFFAIEV